MATQKKNPTCLPGSRLTYDPKNWLPHTRDSPWAYVTHETSEQPQKLTCFALYSSLGPQTCFIMGPKANNGAHAHLQQGYTNLLNLFHFETQHMREKQGIGRGALKA